MRPPQAVSGPSKWTRRRRFAHVAVALVVMMVATVFGLVLFGASRTPTRQRTPRNTASEPASAQQREKATKRAPRIAPAVRIGVAYQDRIDEVAEDWVGKAALPGCVVVIGQRSGVVFRRAYGIRAVYDPARALAEDTVFDLASMTKPVVTAASIFRLVEEGRVHLDDRVTKYLPEFGRSGKDAITVRDLLLHRSGLPSVNPKTDYEHGRRAAEERVFGLSLLSPPGQQFRYSDVGFIVLGWIVERVSGETLAAFSERHFFGPLAMHETMYRPSEELRQRAAPTELRQDKWMIGDAHDPLAFRLNGIAGNAGLFSTGDDLARYARMMLGEGELDGVRVLSSASMRAMTEPTTVGNTATKRTLGWDVRSSYSGGRVAGFSERAYGHTGFTGTALWIDPEKDLFVLFLSNRVHPDGGRNIYALVRAIAEIAIPAVAHIEPRRSRGTVVRTGIDMLRDDGYVALRGARVGLITNVSGRARDGRRTVDLLSKAPGVQLVALFAPEHGLGANAEGRIGEDTDARTGLPVYSLFGADRRPSAEQLAGIDTIVFDIQDVGARFYTYMSTMRAAMETAAQYNKRFVVLDRPNPIDGIDVEGPILDMKYESFVNYHPLPVRHGMTAGELAKMLNTERRIGARLDIVPMDGWSRAQYFDDTDLPWIAPSPNLPSSEDTLTYPALALVEGTNVSVGRGTEKPFRIVAAPWINAEELAAQLARESLPGVRVVPTHFTPSAAVYRARECHGVELTITDRGRFRPVRTGLALARALFALYPDRWDSRRLALMIANASIINQLRANDKSLDEIEASWRWQLDAFMRARAKYLLY